jgi:putative spermidine/putrescine transport system ATP-binding protein
VSELVLAGVRKAFGTTVALEHLDLQVGSGELVSLLGPSGCGKTTALRIAAGFERPDAGAVVVAGTDVSGVPPERRTMGMVFQAYSLFPNLTVADNVAFGLRMRRVDRGARDTRVHDMLELVGLGDKAGQWPHQLSGGQQQRVALARALAFRPDVLLLDEPLSALDAKVRAQLRDEIRRIQTELGTTTLFVTHDQEEALAISDRVGVMSKGRLEQLAAPTELYERPATAFVARFVGAMNEVAAEVVGPDAVVVSGTPVVGIDHGGSSVGTPLTLLVRPEHLRIGDGGIPGIVLRRTFSGPMTTLHVRLDGGATEVRVLVPSAAASGIEPGDLVHLVIERAVCEPAVRAEARSTEPAGQRGGGR